MDKLQPYEYTLKQQMDELNELPLPDQDLAWEKMQLLLDKDDDGSRGFPPLKRKGCLLWIILLLFIIGISWWFVRPERWLDSARSNSSFKKNNQDLHSDSTGDFISGKKQVPVKSRDSKKEGNNDTITADSATVTKKSAGTIPGTGIDNPGKDNQFSKQGISYSEALRKEPLTKGRIIEKNKKYARKGARKVGKISGEIRREKDSRMDESVNPEHILGRINIDSLKEHTKTLVQQAHDSMGKTVVGDSASKNSADLSVAEKDSLDNKRRDSTKKFYFSAGLGLQQQVPIAGQKATPYNYYGRKGSLADYIPSVHFRFHRQEKWFLEAGFRYGAPQTVKEISYSQTSTTQIDTTQGQTIITITTTNSNLKKTFYHQLPVSFNYSLFPKWVVGIGVQYSRFHGAVSEQETHRQRNQVDTLISKKIIQVPASDSFFTRSQIHFLFQTEYQWRHWAAGLRYTHGLQPFIRYTDAYGVAKKETNQSLQVYLRFRIWRSK